MQKNGIASEIYSLTNNEEIRPSANLVISKCSAYDYLNNSNPNLEKLTVKYYDTFSITSRFTGYISNITIGDFYNDLSSENCGSTAILGGLNSTARQEKSEGSNGNSGGNSSGNSNSEGGSSETSSSENSNSNPSSSGESNSNQSSKEQNDIITNPEDLTAGTSSVIGKRGTENIGIAVFDDDKFCGELTATESICHLMISNKVDSCIITIDNPIAENKKMELQIFPSKNSKISTDIKDNKLRISLKIKVNADVLTLENDIDYESNEVLEKISSATEKYLTDEFHNYLNKVSKEYETDIDHFCIKALGHFATIPEWKNFNWKEKFKDAEFDVNVDANVISTLLITKT